MMTIKIRDIGNVSVVVVEQLPHRNSLKIPWLKYDRHSSVEEESWSGF